MGSQGIPRRKSRPRRGPGGPGGGTPGDWELQNSPYTFEGQMEGFGRFGRGLSVASPRARLMAKIVAALFILPFVVGLVTWVID
jgi:hypothetical protein